jgi:tartrate-resistant acid phosphatase type 5
MSRTSDQRRLARRLSWVVLALIVVLLTLLPVTAYRESSRHRTRVIEAPVYVPPVYPTTQSVTVADPSAVSLIAFGDWGRNSAAERAVANGIRARGAAYDAGLLLGDNFYFPLTGTDDPRWHELFEDLYQPADLRFWAVLGNHDYITLAGPRPVPGQPAPGAQPVNMDIEFAYTREHPGGRFNLPSRWYRLDLPAEQPTVTVLMLDTNYRERTFGGKPFMDQQTAWLRQQLDELRPPPDGPAGPRRAWIICCAHHPIFTNGNTHDDDARLKREWLPMLDSHGVDFYLAGHNHCLEHVQVPGSRISHLVSGGGGANLYPRKQRHPGWFAQSYGFTHLVLRPDRAEVSFVDTAGRVMHSFTRYPDGREQVMVADHPATPLPPVPAGAPGATPVPDDDD